jgi:hypothetical protein
MEYRRNNSNVFEPGFTTKKEAGIRIIFNKRIVEEYHRGSIKVSHSEIGKVPNQPKKHPNFNTLYILCFVKHRLPYCFGST